MALKLRHKQTDACVNDWLKFIYRISKKNNKCVKSVNLLKKKYSKNKASVKKHFYCSICKILIKNEGSQCDACQIDKKSYFVEINLIQQLKLLFKRKGFLEKLNKSRRNSSSEINGQKVYKDIYDGSLYQDLSKSRSFLSQKNSISFTWYSDGLKIFNSSKYSIWPFF